MMRVRFHSLGRQFREASALHIEESAVGVFPGERLFHDFEIRIFRTVTVMMLGGHDLTHNNESQQTRTGDHTVGHFGPSLDRRGVFRGVDIARKSSNSRFCYSGRIEYYSRCLQV